MRAAAKIKPILESLYGPRLDVTEYRTCDVLRELSVAADESRLENIVNRNYQKIMSRAK